MPAAVFFARYFQPLCSFSVILVLLGNMQVSLKIHRLNTLASTNCQSNPPSKYYDTAILASTPNKLDTVV
jgi:hypothetical protein